MHTGPKVSQTDYHSAMRVNKMEYWGQKSLRQFRDKSPIGSWGKDPERPGLQSKIKINNIAVYIQTMTCA